MKHQSAEAETCEKAQDENLEPARSARYRHRQHAEADQRPQHRFPAAVIVGVPSQNHAAEADTDQRCRRQQAGFGARQTEIVHDRLECHRQ